MSGLVTSAGLGIVLGLDGAGWVNLVGILLSLTVLAYVVVRSAFDRWGSGE
jgi:hypothetical protein